MWVLLAAIIVLVVILLWIARDDKKNGGNHTSGNPGSHAAGNPGSHAAGGNPGACLPRLPIAPGPDLADHYPFSYGLTANDQDTLQPRSWAYFPDKPEARSVLYNTADVDPIVTGQLYDWRDNTRDTYANRTSLGDKYGLSEYSSGVPGQLGVDVGPIGLYNTMTTGGRARHDDGIPENWRLPDTPVNYYAPMGGWTSDFYGPDGPTVARSQPLYSLTEPDHDPQIGPDPPAMAW